MKWFKKTFLHKLWVKYRKETITSLGVSIPVMRLKRPLPKLIDSFNGIELPRITKGPKIYRLLTTKTSGCNCGCMGE